MYRISVNFNELLKNSSENIELLNKPVLLLENKFATSQASMEQFWQQIFLNDSKTIFYKFPNDDLKAYFV